MDVQEEDLYLSADEAASRLGISLATLYAYVSRKNLRSLKVEGSRSRRYWAADIERLSKSKVDVGGMPELQRIRGQQLDHAADRQGFVLSRPRRGRACAALNRRRGGRIDMANSRDFPEHTIAETAEGYRRIAQDPGRHDHCAKGHCAVSADRT